MISRLALEIVVIALGKRQGWFDLDLQGTETQIQNGLNYLQELKLQVWDENSISDW
nr:NIL domain-containing protein [Dolichospermum sp. UHCC 0315A]